MKIPEDEVNLVRAMATRMDAILNQHQPEFPVLFMSPYEIVHDALRAALPHRLHSFDRTFTIGDTQSNSAMSFAIPRHNRAASIGRPVPPVRFRPFNFYYTIVNTDQNIRALHNVNPNNTPVEKYITWTIDDEREIYDLLFLRVDGIISNELGRLRRAAVVLDLPIDP